MADSEIQIKFGADTSKLSSGMATIRSLIGDLGSTFRSVNDQLSGMSRLVELSFKAPPLGLANGLRDVDGAASGATRAVAAFAETSGEGAKKLLEFVGQAAEGKRGLADMAGAAVTAAAGMIPELAPIAGVIGGIAKVAVEAAQNVWDFAQRLGELGEKTEHAALQFRMSVAQYQRVQGIATAAGVDIGKLAKAAGDLSGAFAQAKAGGAEQRAAFEQIGISTREAYTPAQLLSTVLQKLGQADGPEMAAKQAKALGVNLEGLEPVLAMTQSDWADVNRQIEAYGLVNDKAVGKSAELGAAFAENKNAMQGVQNVLMDALAPAFVAVVKCVNDLISAFVDSYNKGGLVRGVVDIIVDGFKILISIVESVGVGIDFVFKTIDGAAWMLAGGVVAAFDVINGSVKLLTDAFLGLGRVVAHIFTGNWGALGGDIKNSLSQLTSDVAGAAKKTISDLNIGIRIGSAEWKSAENDYLRIEALLKAMWASKGRPEAKLFGRLGAGEGQAELQTSLGHSSTSDCVCPSPRVAVSPSGKKANTTAANSAIDDTHANAGMAEVVEAKAVNDELVQLGAAKEKALVQVAVGGAEARDGVVQAELKRQKDAAHKWVDPLVDSFSKGVQGIIEGTETLRGTLQKIGKQIFDMGVKHISDWVKEQIAGEVTKTAATAAAVEQRAAIEQAGAASQAGGWLSSIQTWLFGEEAKTAATAAGVGVRTTTETAGAATSTAVSATSALTQIAHHAAVAAAGAFQAIARIPFVGPILAPAAAAAALGAVMAFGKSIFSAEGGWGQVPYDGALTELHKDEMVLPASIARPLRDSLGSGAANSNTPSAANDAGGAGGDQFHLHIHAMDGASVERVLLGNSSAVRKAMEREYRALRVRA